MQVAEVDPLPEAAAKAVTEPAGDGERPQSDRQLGESQSLLVSAAFHLRNQSVKQMEAEAV